MTKKRLGQLVLTLAMIAIGCACYCFVFVNINMVNKLAAGGVSGLTLIGHALFGINPAISQLVINIPLLVLGYRIFGKRGLALTIYGTACISFFVWLFQQFPVDLGLENDTMIAAIMAGVLGGIGTGLVFRAGGTTGGGDIVARFFEEKFGVPLNHTLFGLDAIVLLLSLTYIDLKNMMYTLVFSFVLSSVVNIVRNGGYAVRGMLIITEKPEEAARDIMRTVTRGATVLHGEGAYTGSEKRVLYIVLSPQEVVIVKEVMRELDPRAFISIMNVHEVVGEGFTYDAEKRKMLKRLNQQALGEL